MSEQNTNEQPVIEQAAAPEPTGVLVLGFHGASQTNAIAIMAGDIFKGIDFSGLNSAVEAIAGKASELNKEEKEAAIAIVSDWENGVGKRLQEKLSEMNNFLGFFEIRQGRYNNQNDVYSDMLDDIGVVLAHKTNTNNEFEAYMTARDALSAFEQTRPEQPYHDGNTTPIQKIRRDAEYDKLKAIYDLEHNKKSRAVQKAEIAWKNLLREHADVKELMRQARNFSKNMGKFKTDCHEKGQLAKLNINIASQDVRNSLRELVNFTKTL